MLQTTNPLMAQETDEAAACIDRLLLQNRGVLKRIANRFRARPPAMVITCARGSSDNAATYGKYLIETHLGIPTASMGLSVASIFASPVRVPDALCVAISQSGQSPDLLAAVRACKAGGGFVVALTNDSASPLAAVADEVIDLCAAPERSVAATKSFIASLAGLVALVATCSGNAALSAALSALPQVLETAKASPSGLRLTNLMEGRSMFVLGRGYGLGIAQEAALKLKETCAIHAEAFSSAEVRHGPMQIISRGFPVLGFATSDEAGAGVAEVCSEFAARGAMPIVASIDLAVGDPCLEPLLMIQNFYLEACRLALARHLNPDAPQYLKKCTLTQ